MSELPPGSSSTMIAANSDPLTTISSTTNNGLLQARGLMMTYNYNNAIIGNDSPATSAVINTRTDFNRERRSVEDATRHLRNSLTNAIQPLVDSARYVNISSFLNQPQHQQQSTIQNNTEQPTISTSNSVVVNLGPSSNDDPPSIIATAPIANDHDNNDPPIVVTDNNNPDVETQEAILIIQRYVPFVLILLVKGLYDHHEGILNFIILLATFIHANNVVKKEATKAAKSNKYKLLLALLYIVVCITFIQYIFDEEQLYLNLIFIRTYSKPLSVWDLLWFVSITDFILKLITIVCKILLTLMPGCLVAYKKRGKLYLLMEAVSQLYRSLATIQPWLYYLLESYQGSVKILGVILAAAYMIFKGADIMCKLKLMKVAVLKLLQNMNIGSAPTKDQITSAGEHCPICHDQYENPVLLQCRHIFCENCVTTWFDREQTCPLCRAKIVDDPSWRDGSTTFFMQLF